ncbi:hypothetical protein ACIQZB_24855 [Streptomyces sp. NPDC097727]|uniref:hypothetical protein n=1 Tax=Streptomyces sp. NPDC097727 TaxID=3366092 RepID=UPI0037F957F4
MEAAGALALLVEMVPGEVAEEITKRPSSPEADTRRQVALCSGSGVCLSGVQGFSSWRW